MYIKTVTAFSESALDKKINKFLDNNDDEIVDIKFSTSIFYVSAMVILRN
ncbi:hypothetical protein [Staphylococcus succinus]|nr:hypothetical protein [Staphylococcus succinus]MBU0439345.1 hypothetical protein [Staphylococcus succinus]